MSSLNFFSLLEDNSSSEPIEIAKKKAQLQQQQPKPQPKEVAKDAKEQPKQQKTKEGGEQKVEKTRDNRPQTSTGEQRGRGRGDRQQRPQTAGGEQREQRGERGPQQNRGRGRGGDRQQGDNNNENRPRRPYNPEGRENREGRDNNRPPRQFQDRAPTGSPVDTTSAPVGDKFYEKKPRVQGGKPHHSEHDGNQERRGRQFDRSVSGTGRGRGMKKGGEGAHNWGAEGGADDVRRGTRPFQKGGRSEGKVVVKGEDTPIEGVTSPIKEDPAENNTAETPVDGDAKPEDAKVETPKEEGDDDVTYEEYLKQQAEKKNALAALRPNSVAAPATVAPTTDKKKKEKKEKVAKVGEPVSIQEFLKDRAEQLNQARENERDRGFNNRGGRGGARKTGNQRQKANAPDVADQKLFPSLSGK